MVFLWALVVGPLHSGGLEPYPVLKTVHNWFVLGSRLGPMLGHAGKPLDQQSLCLLLFQVSWREDPRGLTASTCCSAAGILEGSSSVGEIVNTSNDITEIASLNIMSWHGALVELPAVL